MFTFKLLDINAIEERIGGFADRTVFQTAPWLNFVAETQQAKPIILEINYNGKVAGYFTGLIIIRFGMKILGSPFSGWTTSYMGFNLEPGINRLEVLKALVRFAFSELGCIHVEIMDRGIATEECDIAELGFRPFKGYEIDLRKSEPELFANMSEMCRRNIRKAQKNGVVIEEASDTSFADDYYEQLQDVFAKQGLVPTYNIQRVRKLIELVYASGNLLLLRARNPEGKCIATAIYPAMNQNCYFWGGASFREYQHLRPNELVQWYAMRYWKERCINFCDLGGAGAYKQKYGGDEISVPWFRVSKYSQIMYLRNMAQTAHVGLQKYTWKLKQLTGIIKKNSI